MTYQEILESARPHLGKYCKGCEICNGKVCKNQIPGPGAKGVGDVAIRNYEKWQAIRIHMDIITENRPVDTTLNLFGNNFRYPFFAAPIGAVNLHYGEKYNDLTYNDVILSACAEEGIAGFTGDGINAEIVKSATKAIRRVNGVGVPIIKPWDLETLQRKMQLVKESGAFATGMDIDAVGLPILKDRIPPAGSKSVVELKEIIDAAGVPFIIKGIMTAKGALKAKEAGATAIVVSNHGGRVLDGCPSTVEVLPEIVAAVGKDIKVLVDGGIRSGTDIFRALALGADGVLIGRPFAVAVYGAGEEGVRTYIRKLGAELEDTMAMCGAYSLEEISREMIMI